MDENRTLNNNQIGKFILRIDIDKSTPIDFSYVVDALQGDYTSKKIEVQEHYDINIDEQKNEGNVAKSIFPRFVLTYADGAYLKLGTFDNNIIIESNKYRDNSVYKDRIAKVLAIIKEKHGEGISSTRIGMRYINTFPCENEKDISKIFNPSDSKSIREGLSKPNISRVLLVSEFNEEDHQIRIQYGVPNKFYPSIITRPDLMLDIDVFSLGLQPINEWEGVIRTANHDAFRIFNEYIKASYIEKMR